MREKYRYKLYGAILGDLVGQPFEFGKYDGKLQLHNPDSIFTDDTIMTLASAKFMIDRLKFNSFKTIEEQYKEMGSLYTGDHYGKGFKAWLSTPLGTVNDSYGNGCIMRASPFMYGDNSMNDCLCSIMHSHLHGMCVDSIVKLHGAYLTDNIKYGDSHLTSKKRFKVESDATVDLILSHFDQTPKSTQESILDMVQLGGDTDTNASIIGELCNFHYKDLSRRDVEYVESKLDDYLLNILLEFNNIFL